MKLSVAMCTYNGAKYIREQLDSILNQMLPVDEIVICDDGSTDGTHSIISQYIEKYPRIISLHVNKENLGVCANFDKVIHLCTGDVIFLADQDDVWYENKTLIICQYFERHHRKDVVFTNADIIDNNGNKRGTWPRTLFQSFWFNNVARFYFNTGFELNIILKHERATGATMAMRRSFVPSVMIDASATIKNGKPIHDSMIALCAIHEHKLGYISRCTMGYRCHESQQTGANFKYEVSNNIILPYCFVKSTLQAACMPEGLKLKCLFLQSRIDDKNNPRQVIRKASQYMNYYKLLSPIVFGFDLSKALYRHCAKGIK